MCEGIGYVETEQYNGKTQFYIAFRQPVPFLYHTGNSRNEEMMMHSKRIYSNRFNQFSMGPMPSDDWFEVFLSGKGFPYNIVNISSKTVKQVIIGSNGQVLQRSQGSKSMIVGIDQQMLYLHKIDVGICRGHG